MRRTIATLLGGLALFALSHITPAPAAAATLCTDSHQNVVINGDVTVPAGAYCYMEYSTVNGSINVQFGGNLQLGTTEVQKNVVLSSAADFGSKLGKIGGDLVITGSSDPANMQFTLCGTDVNGSVTINGLDDEFFTCWPDKASIGGSMTVWNSGKVGLHNLSIGSNVIVSGNHGSINITNTKVTGSLSCYNNTEQPTGGSNTAATKLGQCAAI